MQSPEGLLSVIESYQALISMAELLGQLCDFLGAKRPPPTLAAVVLLTGALRTAHISPTHLTCTADNCISREKCSLNLP